MLKKYVKEAIALSCAEKDALKTSSNIPVYGTANFLRILFTWEYTIQEIYHFKHSGIAASGSFANKMTTPISQTVFKITNNGSSKIFTSGMKRIKVN